MGQFDSFAAFIAMSGYGVYVWSAFAATFLCMALLTVHTFYVRKVLRSEALKQLARLERIEKARAARKAARATEANGNQPT